MTLWALAALAAGIVLYFATFALMTRRIAADAERKVPPSGKFVDVDGNRIHYVEAGKGPPILFIHGLSAQARVIVGFMEKLGLERPLVVGHSFGGIVALAIAIDHPDRLSGLALISPHTRYSDKNAPEFPPLVIAQT